MTHHDIEPMPNGNVLLIAWEVKSSAEAVAAGRTDRVEMWPDHIIEVEPSGARRGTIVWEWHAWDHIIQDRDPDKANHGVVADHPELIDLNLGRIRGGGDWLHINGISYNPQRDEIVISSHFLNEIYVIDHSTTTREAAGHVGGRSGKGGDILYRWGNPRNYGAPGAQRFYVVHCSWWVPEGLPGAGNILAFNNGSHRPDGSYSGIEELTPPLDAQARYLLAPGAAFGPEEPSWRYVAPRRDDFFSNHLGSVQRLASGNTFICEATRLHLFEVTPEGETVWEYTAQHGRRSQIARAMRYPADYPGLARLGR